jgi:hypothetical protein
LNISFLIYKNENMFCSLSKGFESHSVGAMKGYTMTIDGLVVRTMQPFSSETDDILDYRNRKGGYAIGVLAGCDINARFQRQITPVQLMIVLVGNVAQ